MRRHAASLLTSLSFIVLLAVPAVAQDWCSAGADVSDDALAARFSPVLRFAPSEPYFPTVPFFYAFDGVDNDRDGRIDFEDSDEIAAYNPDDTVHTSWEVLDSRYNDLKVQLSPDPRIGTPVAPVPAVFYRVRDLDDKSRAAMRHYLKKDILAWDRALETELGALDLPEHPVKVIEYYFYYTTDKGLVGHPQDIEFTFVFVPADPALACAARVIVGAGHTDRVPNNVLVLSNELVLGVSNLARDDTLTGVITELGGHSSAPDVPPYGAFRLGVDVNWQANKTWGTRDVQALAQMGYGGAYKPDMTLPRDTIYHPVYLWPRGAEYDYGQDYSLLPAPLFEQLYQVLDSVSAGLTPERWPGVIDSVTVLLDSIGSLLGREELVGVRSLDSLSIQRMAAWNKPMIAPKGREGGVIEPHRGQVWKHSVYSGEPTVLYKSHLFPPSMKSIETFKDIFRLITWGFSTWPGNSHQFQAGLVIPWIELPFEVRGYMNLEAGLVTSDDLKGTAFSLNFTYYNSYFQRVSWYTTAAWLPKDEITGSHFTVSAGPSLLLWMKSNKSLLGPLNALRLSTGPRFRLSSGSTGSGVDWEFKFAFRQ
jgi:hypothetical protein